MDIILDIIIGESRFNLAHEHLVPVPKAYLLEKLSEIQCHIFFHEFKSCAGIVLDEVAQLLILLHVQNFELVESLEQF